MERSIIVIKIGTKCVFENGAVKYDILDKIAREVAGLKSRGQNILLVVSGAIPLGRNELQAGPSKNRLSRQVCAGIGQIKLMRLYEEALVKNKLQTMQCLVNLGEKEKDLYELFDTAFGFQVIPLVNFNDVLDFEKAERDNDRLAAKIVVCVNAKMLLILTNDVDGLMHDSRLIETVQFEEIEKYKSICTKKESDSAGSMEAKLEAAKIVTAKGRPCIIGNVKHEIEGLIAGKEARTLICGKQRDS